MIRNSKKPERFFCFAFLFRCSKKIVLAFRSTQNNKPIYKQGTTCPYFMMPVQHITTSVLKSLAAERPRADLPFFDLSKSVLDNYPVLAEIIIECFFLIYERYSTLIVTDINSTVRVFAISC